MAAASAAHQRETKMKHFKVIGFLMMATGSLLAFAGGASAATFTAPAGTTYFGTFSASLQGSLLLKSGFSETTCTSSTIAGQITTNNDTHASGPITSVSFSNCGSWTIDTLNSSGTLTINKSNTEVTGTGVEITHAGPGVSCVYGFGIGTSLGTASNTPSGVKLNIRAKLNKISGGFLCSSPAELSATYLFTIPSNSVVH